VGKIHGDLLPPGSAAVGVRNGRNDCSRLRATLGSTAGCFQVTFRGKSGTFPLQPEGARRIPGHSLEEAIEVRRLAESEIQSDGDLRFGCVQQQAPGFENSRWWMVSLAVAPVALRTA
jgi:hypothetical protein